MKNTNKNTDKSISWLEVIKLSAPGVFVASLCCLSPIILFSLSLVSLSVASDLANVFYGEYKWVFRAVGLLALLIAFVMYMRRAGVCTIDEVVQRRNEILNKLFLVIISGVVGYIFFLYVVVHYIGVFLTLWK